MSEAEVFHYIKCTICGKVLEPGDFAVGVTTVRIEEDGGFYVDIFSPWSKLYHVSCADVDKGGTQ